MVEPWLTPDVFEAGRSSVDRAETPRGRVERTYHAERRGHLSRLLFDYRIEDSAGVHRLSEVHELGLFSVEEMQAAFASVGLAAAFDPVGLTGRGLWVAQGEPRAQ